MCVRVPMSEETSPRLDLQMVVDHHVGMEKWTPVSVRAGVLKHWAISPALCLTGCVKRPEMTTEKCQLPQVLWHSE